MNAVLPIRGPLEAAATTLGEVPDWSRPYLDPWTTPAALWLAIVAVAAVIRLRGRALALVAVGTAIGIAVWKSWVIGPPNGLLDLQIYTNSARTWLDGGSLFTYRAPVFNLGATYPPIGILPFVLLDPLSADAREVLFTLLSIGAVAVAARAAAVLAGVAAGRRVDWTLWAVAIAVVSMPVWLTLRQGQVNALLWAMVLGDVLLLRRGSRLAGIGIGAATAIKLVPGLFILWLLVCGWRRPALRAVLTAVGSTALGWVLAPGDSRRFWTELLWNSDNVGRLDDARNNSVLGALADVLGAGPLRTALWLGLAALLCLIGMRRARDATRRGDLLVAVIIVGCTSALISPISWTHHLGYLVLAGAALLPLVVGDRRRILLLGLLALPVIDPGHLGDSRLTSLLRMALMVGIVLALPIIDDRSGTPERSPAPADTVPPRTQALTTPSRRSTNS